MSGVPTVPGTLLNSQNTMKQSTDVAPSEPVGIVISGGHSASQSVPRFSAYIWAPAPEDEVANGVQAA